MVFKELAHFFSVVIFMSIKLFIIFPCYPFNVCRNDSDTPVFIANFNNHVFSPFIFVNLSRGISFYIFLLLLERKEERCKHR